MRVLDHGGLIDDQAVEGSGADVEKFLAGEADFDGAAVVFHDVDAAAQKIPIEEDIAGGGLQADVVGAGLQPGWKLPLMDVASRRPAQRVQTSEPPTLLMTRMPSTSW